jgi:very-short-patch-repair endonuclease
VARTVFDLARIVSPVMLDANLDAALRRQLVSIDELVQTAERLATRGRPGGRAFSVAVRTRTQGAATAESVPERLLARLLEKQGLGPPVLQYEVRDGGGRFVARVDLAYPDDALVVEYDSFEHHVGTAALVRDSARRNAIAAVGLTVLIATAADLRDGADRLASSIRHIRQRAA